MRQMVIRRYMFVEEGRRFYRRVRREFRKESGSLPCCFDCGKELDIDDGIIFLDWTGGMLFYCHDCTISRIEIKTVFDKVIPIRVRRR